MRLALCALLLLALHSAFRNPNSALRMANFLMDDAYSFKYGISRRDPHDVASAK
jgi:hypothetical protein